MDSLFIKWLEERCPNKVPTTILSEWELGVLAGERMLVEDIKVKLRIEEVVDENIK